MLMLNIMLMLTLMLTLINDKTCLTRKAFVEQFVDSELEFIGEVSPMVQNVMYAHGEAVLDGRCMIRSLTALNTDILNSVSCSLDHAIP
jgi:hypothetical protein